MGKRKGAAIRAKKRADAAATELLHQSITNAESKKYESKPDDDLFVLDTTPDASTVLSIANNKKRKLERALVKKENDVTSKIVKTNKKHHISSKDERQIRKLLTTHTNEKVLQISRGQNQRLDQRKRAKRTAGLAKANFDLWDDHHDDGAQITSLAANAVGIPTKSQNTKKLLVRTSGVKSVGGTAPVTISAVHPTSLRKDLQQPPQISNRSNKIREKYDKVAKKKVSIELARPGQSYRPDVEQHQESIGEALAIELRRKEALEERAAPIGGGGLSEETKMLLVGDTSDEESDDDDKEEDGDVDVDVKVERKREKLTRAQRNRQKRVRAMEKELSERKNAKKLLSSINDSKSFLKNLRKEESIHQERRAELNRLKAETKAQPLGQNIMENLAREDPVNVPALPVALTEDIQNGSLRTVKPKGSLLTDRVESMASRKMVNKKVVHKRNVVEGKRRKMKSGKNREFLLV